MYIYSVILIRAENITEKFSEYVSFLDVIKKLCCKKDINISQLLLKVPLYLENREDSLGRFCVMMTTVTSNK